MTEPVTEIRYTGEVQVRPYRRGTWLGARHFDEVIERALGDRYSFGEGWQGEAEVTIRLFERQEGENAA